MWSNGSPSPGLRVGSVASGHGLCAPPSQMACIAAAGLQSCTASATCSRAATAIGLRMSANRIDAPSRARKGTENPDAIGREREHV